MSIYLCDYCDEQRDSDVDLPSETKEYGCVCEDCNIEYFDEDGNEVEDEPIILKRGGNE